VIVRVCYCMHCVIEANPECYIGTIHCSCELVTYRALFLVDAIRNRALRCKCRLRRILPSFLCSKRRKAVQNNLEVESEEDEDLNS
jgi:hypothetical protein